MRATLKGDSRAVPVLCGCMIFLCLRFISGCSGLHARPDRPKSLCMDILGIRCRHLRHAPCNTLQRDSLCSLQRHARTCRPRNRMLQAACPGQTAPDKTAEPVCAGDRRFCALRYRSRIWRSHGRNNTAWNTLHAASSCKMPGDVWPPDGTCVSSVSDPGSPPSARTRPPRARAWASRRTRAAAAPCPRSAR